MSRIAVLGAGRVGRAIALDLAARHEVRVADADAAALTALEEDAAARSLRLATGVLDALDGAAVAALVADADLAVSAVPGSLGFAVLGNLIRADVDVVDISFFPEDPFLLDAEARERGRFAVVDAGVAPGLDNLVLGHHAARMEVDDFACLVGGLPFERAWPFQYKAPFSPADVIEEYLRPARLREHGRDLERPALCDPELVDFDGIGTLEAFLTDGLRTLLRTLPEVRNMREKTLRWPGHRELVLGLARAGFFDETPLAMRDASGAEVAVRPRDAVSAILFRDWALGPSDREFTVMRVDVSGRTPDGEPLRVRYELRDAGDPETRTSSMARTTGYTCTGIVEWVLGDAFEERGVVAPERLGAAEGALEFVLRHLDERGVLVVRDLP